MKNKILLIDDDKDVLKSLERLLGGAEYAVTAVCDSLKAVEMVKNDTFDLIISDIRMPNLGGIETIKTIKMHQNKRDGHKSEFLVITGYADDDAPREGASLGITNFMIKPFDSDVFLKTVENCLNSGKKNALKIEELKSKNAPVQFAHKYFSMEKKILLKETNLMGNTYFANYILWQGEARELGMMAHPNFAEEMKKNQHIKMITHSLYHRFVQETTFGDIVEIRMTAREIKHCSFVLVFRYYNKRTNAFLGDGWQRVTFADSRTGSISVIPDFVRELVMALQEDFHNA